MSKEPAYREEMEQGTLALMGAFAASIGALFEKPLLVLANQEKNQFADLPKHVQLSIVRAASANTLAQCMAQFSLSAGERIEDKDICSMEALRLKQVFKMYKEEFRRTHENSMDKGSKAGDAPKGTISNPGSEAGCSK